MRMENIGGKSVNNIILFVNGKCAAAGNRLRKSIESVVSCQHLEIQRSIKDLSKRLNRFPREIDLAVLFAASKDQLSELLSLRELLNDVRIILILPDRGRETISKGHLLRPRFLSYADGDLTDVIAVLSKMIVRLNYEKNRLNPRDGQDERRC